MSNETTYGVLGEFKDATDEERTITLCNSGVVAADARTLFDACPVCSS